ncbi:cis-prenyltransferase [Conglomerata obtusa]
MKKHRLIYYYAVFLDILANSSLFTTILLILSQFSLLTQYLKPSNKLIKSIAFIMDGNRRHAKQNKISDTLAKKHGFEKMLETLQTCHSLNINEASFFAFSLSNFKRSATEIDSIMGFITEHRRKFYELDSIKPRIKIYGRSEMLSSKVKCAFEEMTQKTALNCDINMNVFFAYGARDEIENGIVFDKEVDLLVRTSGERRLSDFMLRQCANGTVISFVKECWPRLSILKLYFLVYKANFEKNYFFVD